MFLPRTYRTSCPPTPPAVGVNKHPNTTCSLFSFSFIERPAAHWWQTKRHLVPVVSQSRGSLNTCSSCCFEFTFVSSICNSHITPCEWDDRWLILCFPIVVDHKQFRFFFLLCSKFKMKSTFTVTRCDARAPASQTETNAFIIHSNCLKKTDQTVKRFSWCFHKLDVVYSLALRVS